MSPSQLADLAWDIQQGVNSGNWSRSAIADAILGAVNAECEATSKAYCELNEEHNGLAAELAAKDAEIADLRSAHGEAMEAQSKLVHLEVAFKHLVETNKKYSERIFAMAALLDRMPHEKTARFKPGAESRPFEWCKADCPRCAWERMKKEHE